jgi:predicted nucleic acid-binding protein
MRTPASPSTTSYMVRRTECYVDTSALIAFLDRSDSYHPLFKRLFSDPPPLVTSALVIAEGHGWFLRRYDQNRAVQFLNFVLECRLSPSGHSTRVNWRRPLGWSRSSPISN